MFKVNRQSPLYGYLDLSFKIFARFHGTDVKSRDFNGLEKSDFCRIVRVSCFYVPLIFFSQFVLLTAVFGWMVLKPLLTSVDPMSAFIPMLIVLLVVSALFGSIIGAFIFLDNRSSKKSEKRQVEWERLYRLFLSGEGDHPDTILGKRKTDSGFKSFFRHVYMSFKERFCPIVKFEE